MLITTDAGIGKMPEGFNIVPLPAIRMKMA